jgi:hypothetical protein
MTKLKVRFHLVTSHKEETDKLLGFFFMAQAPASGELINIRGEPYIVVSRAWAVVGDEDTTFCYIRVSPYQFS